MFMSIKSTCRRVRQCKALSAKNTAVHNGKFSSKYRIGRQCKLSNVPLPEVPKYRFFGRWLQILIDYEIITLIFTKFFTALDCRMMTRSNFTKIYLAYRC